MSDAEIKKQFQGCQDDQLLQYLRCWSQRVLVVDDREGQVRFGGRKGDGTVAASNASSISRSLVLPHCGTAVGIEGVDSGTNSGDNGHAATGIDEDTISLLDFDWSKLGIRHELVSPKLGGFGKEVLGGDGSRSGQEEGGSDETTQDHGDDYDKLQVCWLCLTMWVEDEQWKYDCLSFLL